MASSRFSKGLKRSALTVALGFCFIGAVQAQSTVGSIYGQAPAGSTITIQNTSTGVSRQVTVGADGRFNATQLPPGSYRVTSGADTREVNVVIATGTNVNFSAADATTLGGITVQGGGAGFNANAIDVTKVESSTIFTQELIKQLPVPRDVAQVALLAPSVIANSSYASNAPSFGGAASSENAYYINGYPVTNPLTAIGFSTLPFESADQMEVLTGGYGAMFGRSTGGVINVITRRGTNDWKFGGAVYFTPASLREKYDDNFYPNTGYYPDTDGKLLVRRSENKSEAIQYGLYAGGPIIRDRLFFFASGEFTKTDSSGVNASIEGDPNTGWYNNTYKDPRWMAKLDWHITDNHSLELTTIHDESKYERIYSPYDYASNTHGDVQKGGDVGKDGGNLYIGRYTGYLTDNLTISALYGTQKINHDVTVFGNDPACPRISGNMTPSNQMPGIKYNPSTCQFALTDLPPGRFDETKGGRFDVEYNLGNHAFRLGADLMEAHSFTGSRYPGGYVWVFGQTADNTVAIDESHGIGAPIDAGGSGLGTGVPGPNGKTKGYFVRRQYFTNSADVKTRQRAFYLEDRWNVTDNLLLSLGVRNESFTNYNGDGVPYIEQKNQWAPRLGFSWDVNGDSSFKVFGNAGRYHLVLPNNVAARAAASSLYTVEYFTYTGTDPVTGAPTGLKNIPVDATKGYVCPGTTHAVSSNLECGGAPDPRTVAAKDIKAHYQDEFILGMQMQLTPTVAFGVKGTQRSLKSAIDDTCTPALGGRCFIFNPGAANTFLYEEADGTFSEHHFTSEQLGFPKLKRKYHSLETYVEKGFSNNWYGKLEYVYSRNHGNTEGQLHSDLDTGGGGQSDVSVTQDWDLPQLMVGAYGLLPNHRAHQLKGYGYVKLGEDWRVGATAVISSGRPLSCTSYYPTADAGLYNGSYYHWCGLAGSGTVPGKVGYAPPSADYVFAPRGTSGFTPWTQRYNMNVEYRPGWAGHKLGFTVDVFNIFNQQVPQFYNMQSAANRVTRSRYFGRELSPTAPRSVRFTVRYDF